MAEYGKKTVAELTEILKSRGLPSSGKKAELIARLNENDKEAAAPQAEEGAATEVISAPAVSQPAETPTAPTVSAESAPVGTEVSAQPDTTDAQNDTSLADQTTYALNLPSSNVDNELAKRKARAERFGTGSAAAANVDAGATAVDTEAQKILERARRFGTGQTAIGMLDQALSSERVRGNKRKAEDSQILDDPALIRRGGGRGGRGRGGRSRPHGGRAGDGKGPTGISKPGSVFSSEKDRLAAEARKKKFATA